jgi:HSP20 family protein
MALIPWKNKRHSQNGGEVTPYAPLMELRTEMDRLFDSLLRDPWGSLTEGFGGDRAWLPAVDVSESDQEVTIRAEIPGIDPKDLDISVSGNRLTLAGEKRDQTEKQGKNFYHAESRYGAFRRTIELPSGVDPNQITAEHSNGVVTVRLKKTQAATAKKIEVKSV